MQRLNALLGTSLFILCFHGCTVETGPNNVEPSSDGGTGGNNGGSGGDDVGEVTERLTAQIDESCDLSVFPGYVLTINEEESSCDTRFTSNGNYIQMLIGESTGEPVAGGRTYQIVEQPDTIYPKDGMADAHYTAPATVGTENAISGTVTLRAENGKIVGDYDLMTETWDQINGTGTRPLSGTFVTELCPLDYESCSD